MLKPGPLSYFFFFFNDTATTEIYTLSLHDALPISVLVDRHFGRRDHPGLALGPGVELLHELRSEEHTSELQSRPHLVCRLLLEKKKKKAALDQKYYVGHDHGTEFVQHWRIDDRPMI